MTERIMKRGLSLEGCEIRQKHQSSLLNKEFGVTSQPTPGKIEKNFLTDNILKLKEIQSKGRAHQDILSISHPIKAIRLKDTNISPDDDIKLNHRGTSQKNRHGSAHSDYFSLSDETPSTDIEQNTYEDCPVIACDAPSKDSPLNNFGNTEFSSVPEYEFDTNYNASHSKEAKTFSSSPISPTADHPSLGYILKKIRKQKPACDLNWDIVWKGIVKEHKIIFHNQISFPNTTSKDTATRKSSISRSSNCLVTPKDAKSACSQSFDRIKPHTASNECNSFSGSPSLSHNQNDYHANNPHPQDKPLIPSTSNCDISNKETMTHTDSFVINSSPNQFSLSSPAPCPPFKGNEFHLEDSTEPKMDNENSANKSIVESVKVNGYFPNKINSDQSEINHTIASSVTSTKEDASIQTSYKTQPVTQPFRSKLSGNGGCSFGNLPPSYKKGEIPKYLKVRKAKIQQRQEAAAAIDPQCPPGHNPLPDCERRNTLHLLKKGQATVLQELCALPLVQDTLALQKRKQQLEEKLAQIDEGIQIFSRPKVYIIGED